MTFARRQFFMRTDQARESAIALIRDLPLDDKRPLQITVEEFRPARTMSQQALLFAGPMTDIATQAFIEGRQYSVEVLHEFCKRQFLPEEFDPALCKDGYEKWGLDPLGERVLIGSTTQLTVKGYSIYLEQIFAFGASLGVNFSTKDAA
jgi:hypothetical protein